MCQLLSPLPRGTAEAQQPERRASTLLSRSLSLIHLSSPFLSSSPSPPKNFTELIAKRGASVTEREVLTGLCENAARFLSFQKRLGIRGYVFFLDFAVELLRKTASCSSGVNVEETQSLVVNMLDFVLKEAEGFL